MTDCETVNKYKVNFYYCPLFTTFVYAKDKLEAIEKAKSAMTPECVIDEISVEKVEKKKEKSNEQNH